MKPDTDAKPGNCLVPLLKEKLVDPSITEAHRASNQLFNNIIIPSFADSSCLFCFLLATVLIVTIATPIRAKRGHCRLSRSRRMGLNIQVFDATIRISRMFENYVSMNIHLL